MKAIWKNIIKNMSEGEWNSYEEFQQWAIQNGCSENTRVVRLNKKEPHSKTNTIFQVKGTKQKDNDLYNIWRSLRYPTNRTTFSSFKEFTTFNESLEDPYTPGAKLVHIKESDEGKLFTHDNCMWLSKDTRLKWLRKRQEANWDW